MFSLLGSVTKSKQDSFLCILQHWWWARHSWVLLSVRYPLAQRSPQLCWNFVPVFASKTRNWWHKAHFWETLHFVWNKIQVRKLEMQTSDEQAFIPDYNIDGAPASGTISILDPWTLLFVPDGFIHPLVAQRTSRSKSDEWWAEKLVWNLGHHVQVAWRQSLLAKSEKESLKQ